MLPLRCARVLWLGVLGSVALGSVSGAAAAQGVSAAAPKAKGNASAEAGVPLPYPGGSGTALGERIATLLAQPAVSRAHWGIAVTTLDGTPLYGLDEGKLFRPASTAKLFTTAAAMDLLGPATRVTTVVAADAPPNASGLVEGDLVIHGVGDPALGGEHYPYENAGERQARLKKAMKQEQAAEDAAARAAAQAERTRQKQAREPTDERAVASAENSASDQTREASLPDALLTMDSLAAQVAAAGVKGLTGAVRADQSLWHGASFGPSWDAGDAVWGYGASVSALEFNDGQLQMRISPGMSAGEKVHAEIEPNLAFAGLPNGTAVTVAAEKEAGIDVLPHGFPAANELTGAVALGHPQTEEIAVQVPALFAADALEQRLLAHGIRGGTGAQVSGSPPAEDARSFLTQVREPVDLTVRPEDATSPTCGRDFRCGIVLARHVSPTVAEDVQVTLKESQNLHAEMLLRRLGRAYGREGTFAQGARVVRQWSINAGLAGDDFTLYDGSGLSTHDVVTPRAEAQLLAFAARQPWFAQWRVALPVGGVDGTLAGRFKDAPLKGHVFAKTGTLGESRALAGYLDCASGRTVIFSVLVDNHLPGTTADREAMDRIVAAIAEMQ